MADGRNDSVSTDLCRNGTSARLLTRQAARELRQVALRRLVVGLGLANLARQTQSSRHRSNLSRRFRTCSSNLSSSPSFLASTGARTVSPSAPTGASVVVAGSLIGAGIGSMTCGTGAVAEAVASAAATASGAVTAPAASVVGAAAVSPWTAAVSPVATGSAFSSVGVLTARERTRVSFERMWRGGAREQQRAHPSSPSCSRQRTT